ncbi:MAG TPA: hypothetical protein VHX37_09160 [Acidobacteriaceae bacterium]|jgi:hypothetical protein|nr:hypothetical protein [Acidobacteriaceae bacterium]
MQNRSLARFLAGATGLLFLLATGCGSLQSNAANGVGTALSGNWAFIPATNNAVSLNLGFTQGAYETVSAVARLNGVSCVGSSTNIQLTGSVNGSNQMTLISSPFSGTILTLKGAVAVNGSAIGNATWSFTGGSCASLGTASVNATNYSTIGGTFTGNFLDGSGNQLPVSAFLQQTTQPDSNGQFSLSGTASFPTNTCFVQQPALTSSLVTGSNLSMTYTDPAGGAVLTATGTFNSAATQLTIANWTIAGGACDGDSGTGSLTEQ